MKTNHELPHAIPVVTNMLAIAVCSCLYFAVLYAASQTESVLVMIAYGLFFAVTMIPIYSLIHEAEHNLLHPNQRWNDFLGRWLCSMWVVSFTFLKHCHLRHHVKNRTDSELWDLYLVHQIKWRRFANLYGMMIGVGYLLIWLSVIVFVVAPSLVYAGFFQKHAEIAGFLEGSDQQHKLTAIRWESCLVIIFQVTIILLLQIKFLPWLIAFLIHGFVWSSQNYVNHAFSPRDVINGAHNLKMPVWLKPVYLNFNLHLAHHQNPRSPWIHLPRFVRSERNRIGFFRNYLRLWGGPRLTREQSPVLHEQRR